jgi:hypothetical protein
LTAAAAPLPAQGPVEYYGDIQPLFDSSCGGSLCHLGDNASDVDLQTYAGLMASIGTQYKEPVVVPGDPAASALYEKIATPEPRFGERMPLDLPPLRPAQIDLVRRWIAEGAREFSAPIGRGDLDRNQRLDITDAINILGFLFLGSAPPFCRAVANANADDDVNIADAVYLLSFLFLGGPDLPPLSIAERIACLRGNQPPKIEPIGTVSGREGRLLEFEVGAVDPDGDALSFRAAVAPEGLEIDGLSGAVRWTPRAGQAGDHRIRIEVIDSGERAYTVASSGLVRIAPANQPPSLAAPEALYGRELALLEFAFEASDPEGQAVGFSAPESPPGSILEADGRFRWAPSAGQAGEHVLRVRAADAGEPPAAAEAAVRIVVIAQDAPLNRPPSLPARGVYRTFPSREIRIAIGASDPEGDALRYRAESLPAGAAFDAESGLFTWTPGEEQLGPFYVPFTVADDGVPPAAAEGILAFKVQAPDPCTVPVCDPATGCDVEGLPIEQDCCLEAPGARVAEPIAGCPEGRVLFLGRNRRGFGRLQSCDRMPIVFFAQGGIMLRLNIEARCVNAAGLASLAVELRTWKDVLIDTEEPLFLTPRQDGFAQSLSRFFQLDPFVLFGDIDNHEALLTVTLRDADGTVVATALRVILTFDDPPDLPEPDAAGVPASEAGCVGCHRPLNARGERSGIEDAHPWHPLSCTDCHGGNASANTRDLAHVPPAFGPTYLRDLASDGLDFVSPDYLRFINPGDLRVASRGCGSLNPAARGSGCHQSVVDATRLSAMNTSAGLYAPSRFLAGSQGRNTIYGAVSAVNPLFDPNDAPAGAIASLLGLREPSPNAVRSAIGTCIDVYLPKACPTCHLSDFGRNDAPGNYRSSGCTACHMGYADDGRSRSADPTISKDFPPHPIKHELSSAISTEQCSHCHFQSGRIGLSYRGIREGGFAPEKTPPNAVSLGVPIHGRDRDFYIVDEDHSNDRDETPPDVHHQAGMVCADCHVGGDVHGDGNLYGSGRYQVGVRCEDCHGTVRAEIREGGDGIFRNSKGFPMHAIRRGDDDRILLGLKMPGPSGLPREIEIPQIHRILESGVNSAMDEAMGVNERGFSHTDALECYTCHTAWRQTCFGCHVTVNDSLSAPNRSTGQSSRGAVTARNNDYSLDFFALGLNHRGKISPVASAMSVFMSYADEGGFERFRDKTRTATGGKLGFGWSPFHHHTVSRVPQNCDRCHPVVPGAAPDNAATLLETFGFGSGKHPIRDGDGVTRDASAFLDEAGNPIGEFPHPSTGPLPIETRQRMMTTEVTPHPRH